MSITYNIACRHCKVRLWIGQRNLGGSDFIYTDEKYLVRLQTFLFAHIRHALVFDDSEILDDYNEIPDPEDDGK